MTNRFESVRAVVFDYGNTVVPFGPPEIRFCDDALVGALERLFGPVDRDKVRAIRDRNRRMPYEGNPPAYRENDLPAMTRQLVRDVCGREPRESEMEDLLRSRFDAFVESIALPRGVKAALVRLGGERSLGLLSNYPDGEAIRASLRKIGLGDAFGAVVVSGDLGYVKPHPLMFSTMLAQLGVTPAEVLLVGDNWLADVQGAKRAGWRMVHMTRWDPPEHFAPAPGDALPDAVIHGLEELLPLLAQG